MPYEDDYYFTIDNASRALTRYDEWRAWTAHHGLVWAGVGLDIEPEARFYEQIMRNPWGLLLMIAPRLFGGRRLREAQVAYAALVDRIRADRYCVENYQFPLVADERRAGSTLLQRLLGLVDVATDREVWMLYTSVMRRIGPGLLWVYGSEAKAIAVGTTGGGPDIPSRPQIPALSWWSGPFVLRWGSYCGERLIRGGHSAPWAARVWSRRTAHGKRTAGTRSTAFRHCNRRSPAAVVVASADVCCTAC